MPRFSVVVPAFNAEATLGETLDAMAAQQFDDWECIIVDDGSTDGTARLAQGYCDADPRFRLIRQANAGTAGAYRTGLDAARADLMVICAADDMLLPGHLAAMDAFITANPESEIYSSNGELLYHDSGERRPVYSCPPWDRELSLSFEEVIACCFYSVGVVFRQSILDETGGHRLGVYVDDYDLWLRAMLGGARHAYTPQILSVHRVSSFQQSADGVRVFQSNIETYENLLGDPRIQPGQRTAIEAAIANNRIMIERLSITKEMDQQSRALRRVVQRVVGRRRVDAAMKMIHKVTGLARPLRRRIAAMRVRQG